jgi:hypothetical protein
MVKHLIVPAALASAVSLVGSAAASAPPVGPLPRGQVTSVDAKRGTLVAIALPAQASSSGLVWRLARRVDPAVARQVSEGTIAGAVIVVYKVVGKGRVTVAYGLTKGETRKAFKSVTYKFVVS